MAYITRNANIVLLFLILISASALVAATVFFQENFDRINTAYNSKMTQLSEVTKDLAEKQQALDQIKSELTLKAAREEEFSQQYSTVKTEKTTLEGEKKQLTQLKVSLENELESTENQLVSTKNSLEAVKGENVLLKSDLAEEKANVVSLNNKIDDYKDDIDDLSSKISCLQTQLAKPDGEEGSC